MLRSITLKSLGWGKIITTKDRTRCCSMAETSFDWNPELSTSLKIQAAVGGKAIITVWDFNLPGAAA